MWQVQLRNTAMMRVRYAARLHHIQFCQFHGSARLLDTQSIQRLPINWGIRIVPQQSAWIIERFGKFHTVLSAGLHLLVPFVDRIAYIHSLKEEIVTIPGQTAITKDNVALHIDGVLYAKVVDPYKASYGIGQNPLYAVEKLAQTTMRSEIGKITLDKTFEERETLSAKIVENINHAALDWGVLALRYEIQDISPPLSVKSAMDLQAEAERRKRAAVLESEGEREAEINIAQGKKMGIILLSEARLAEQRNSAQGDAAVILAKARATSAAIRDLAAAIRTQGGQNAVGLRIAEQYVAAFNSLAKKGNTLILPSDASDVSKMVAQAMSVYSTVQRQQGLTVEEDEAAPTHHTRSSTVEDHGASEADELLQYQQLVQSGLPADLDFDREKATTDAQSSENSQDPKESDKPPS